MKQLISRISEFAGEVKLHVGSIVILWIESMKMRLAMSLADIKQKAMNKRYHVIFIVVGYTKEGKPIEKLRSINRDDFNYCKRRGWLPKHMGYLELSDKSFYSTDLRLNNSQKQEDRNKAMDKYLRYVRIINGLKQPIAAT